MSTVKIKFTQLTMGELDFFETQGGKRMSELGQDFTAKQLTALAFILKKRTGHPGFKWGDAQALTFDECQQLLDDHLDMGEDQENSDDPKEQPQLPSGLDTPPLTPVYPEPLAPTNLEL